MAAPTKEELKARATELGLAFSEEATAGELKEMIKAKESENTPPPPSEGDGVPPAEGDKPLTDDEILKQSEEMKKKLENKDEPKMYSQDEVRDMLEQVAKQTVQAMKQQEDGADQADEPDKQPKTLRLPRFMEKFIIGFENMNKDPYFKDVFIPTKDVYNEQKREFEAWVKVIFHDGSEPLLVNYLTLIRQAKTVPAEIVEVKKKDVSYDFGKVEAVEYDEYNKKGTGLMVKTKVTQELNSYVVKLPGSGQVVEVSRDVVNW